MAAHSASVTVKAPVHQVYQMYTHFNDYPKFMSFVKEVTYLDDQRSHWVVDVAGTHEWEAANEGWVSDRRIGWRSVDGLKNRGEVLFAPDGEECTRVEVRVDYEPPAGVLGDLGEVVGIGEQFEHRLQHDLEQFAQMVEDAPANALDPTSSSYLFHPGSAVARGATTRAQEESMGMRRDGGADNASIATTTRVSTEAPPVPGTSESRELS
jgi:uncharacterized membrane protein